MSDIDYSSDYLRLAKQWWRPDNLLSLFNEVRIPFIVDSLCKDERKLNGKYNAEKPLNGLKIVDVGCGGGILSEELARLGAKVVGIDINPTIIDVAKNHSKLDKNLTDYPKYEDIHISEFSKHHKEEFDAIICSEVIEHVSNSEKFDFLLNCIRCLKPNGDLILTTPNNSFTSKLFFIYYAETFNVIPAGTHDSSLFIGTHQLESFLKKFECSITKRTGFQYSIFRKKFYTCESELVMYGIHAIKK